MSIVSIINKHSVSPDFMQERIERRLQAFAEMNNLDMIDALDKCIDIALLWHRLEILHKSMLLKDKIVDINIYYRS